MAVGMRQQKISYKGGEIDPSPITFYENIFVNVNKTWLGILHLLIYISSNG